MAEVTPLSKQQAFVRILDEHFGLMTYPVWLCSASLIEVEHRRWESTMLEAFHVLPMTVAIGISTGANTLSGSVRECDLIAPHKTPTANCVEGEVALSAYECRFFVVRTKSGFIFLHHVWSGFTLIEGDRVIGPLHTPGIHELVVLYEMTIDVEVESDTTDSMIAQKTFYRRCHHETAPLAG